MSKETSPLEKKGITSRINKRKHLRKRAERRLNEGCHWKDGKLCCGKKEVGGVAHISKPPKPEPEPKPSPRSNWGMKWRGTTY